MFILALSYWKINLSCFLLYSGHFTSTASFSFLSWTRYWFPPPARNNLHPFGVSRCKALHWFHGCFFSTWLLRSMEVISRNMSDVFMFEVFVKWLLYSRRFLGFETVDELPLNSSPIFSVRLESSLSMVANSASSIVFSWPVYSLKSSQKGKYLYEYIYTYYRYCVVNKVCSRS